MEELSPQKLEESGGLKRTLGRFDLVMMGVGCIIGVGIYILSGVASAQYAGPAVILSFILAGTLCGVVALAYGELASMFPSAGSAYTYSYVAFGKKAGWFLGWTLLLEYAVACSAVASGWSSYFRAFLRDALGIQWPKMLGSAIGSLEGQFSVDLPAILIMVLVTAISIRGIKESAVFNNVMAVIKICVLLFFIGFGLAHINPANWQPFIPERVFTIREANFGSGFWELPIWDVLTGLFSKEGLAGLLTDNKFWHFGVQGILSGAAVVFFTYVGFDMVSATAEESKNPQRDIPIGIIGSLIVATVLYILVALVLTGIMPPVVNGLPNDALLNGEAGAPLAIALSSLGAKWASTLISVGALAGVTTTLLTLSLGLSRVFLAISRDGFLPKIFSQIHPKFQTPHVATFTANTLIAIIAASLPIGKLAELCNLGTLAAFAFVCLAVIYLRKTHPEFTRSFQCPWIPWLPLVGFVACLLLMCSLPLLTWLWFSVWLLIGVVIYRVYGRVHAAAYPACSQRQEIIS